MNSLMRGPCSARPGASASASGASAPSPELEASNMREHACWLWSRLGVSLMSLADRNTVLEEPDFCVF